MKKKRTPEERLRAAAIVKLKYELDTGHLDEAFRSVYQGVLSDLGLKEADVDRFISKNRDALLKICRNDG